MTLHILNLCNTEVPGVRHGYGQSYTDTGHENYTDVDTADIESYMDTYVIFSSDMHKS